MNNKQNIACSGAKSEDTWRASHGGQWFKGEAPQADRLAGIAATKDVKMIVLSIGGNDLGFSDIIESYVAHFMFSENSCNAGVQEGLNAKMVKAMAGVGKSIDKIRAVMAANGYATKDYRLILQAYPSPVPRASQLRPNVNRITAGCPMYDADLNWARLSLIPRIASELRKVAIEKGNEFLDLQDLFDRHEVCSSTTLLADVKHSPSRVTSEWARFLAPAALLQGGDTSEYFHPNAFGQVKMGSCFSLLSYGNRGQYDCSSYDDIEYITPLRP
ncbi:hypothetical protein [Streptomyces sp. NPDC058701]|uniref:hypothetical protein n=1 Tax=Streptomyces sp. NPDC058701 TaxID=3346608 RepID=UPI003667AEAA